MLRPFRGILPRIAASAYIDPSAQIAGDVEVGERSSIWLNVSIRGDVNYIRIGAESNVQDNTVIHVDRDLFPCIVHDRVTIGHSAVVHGTEIYDDALIGIGAILLNGSKIGAGAIVAAGSLVPEGMQVPPNMVVMGAPAKVRREVSPEEREKFAEGCRNYVRLATLYKEEKS
jgi:carbonic anhydrase/acetyltransferase-like protein (isoleucine patch superfamily)